MKNEISLDDCFLAYLGPETHTPPLLTEYISSSKKYLLLMGFSSWSFLKHYYYAFIVCRSPYYKDCYDHFIPTFTELKQRVSGNLFYINHCVNIIFNGKTLDPPLRKGQVVLFEKPCAIRGQTIDDRHYGEYGLTTNFVIIGIMIDKICST